MLHFILTAALNPLRETAASLNQEYLLPNSVCEGLLTEIGHKNLRVTPVYIFLLVKSLVCKTRFLLFFYMKINISRLPNARKLNIWLKLKTIPPERE